MESSGSGLSPERSLPHAPEDSEEQTASCDVDEAINRIGMGRTQYELLFLVGVFLAADAAEVSYLSFVMLQLKISFDMSSEFTSLIAGMVFAGQIIGSPAWGMLADKFGRRRCFLQCSGLLLTFALLTAYCRNAWVLLVVRSVVGFGVGGLCVPYTVATEILPEGARDTGLMAVMFFQTVGNLYITFIAWLVLEAYGWQMFTLLAAIPSFVGLLAAFLVLPESPKWLASVERQEEAAKVVNNISAKNGSYHRFTKITTEVDVQALQGMSDVLRNQSLRPSFLMMSAIWFSFGAAFYGILFMEPNVLSDHHGGGTDYVGIAVTNLAQAFGLLLGILSVPRLGCKLLQTIAYAVGGACMLLLSLKSLERSAVMVSLLAVAMAAVSAASCATWTHSAQLFPTTVRATSLATLSAISRIGGFAAPFIISTKMPLQLTAVIVGILCLMAALFAAGLRNPSE